MRVLVTGANGFLGSWLTQKLLSQAHQVSVLLRKSNDVDHFKSLGVRVFQGDITDKSSLAPAIKGQEQVFHLAGLIGYSKKQYSLMHKINVEGTSHVLDLCAQFQVNRVLLVSSVVAIGASEKPEVLNEDSIYNLEKYNFGYHQSKRKAEVLLQNYVREKKGDGVIVNPSTVYGAGDAAKSSRSTQFKVARNELFFYPPGGVSVTAVEDVVDGMILAMEKGRSGEKYILAGENLYLKEVFDLISECAGVEKVKFPLPPWFFTTLANADCLLNQVGLKGPIPSERALVARMFHWYDSTKARVELGYSTRPAGVAIENSVRWMKDNGLLRKS